MKKVILIEIETKSKNDFGIVFMERCFKELCKHLTGFRKIYSARII